MSERWLQPRAVRALASRGLRLYFDSPAAYVALFAFYLLAGYLFVFPLFLVGQASLRGMVEFMPLLLTLLVPALTMGLLSEELRAGTFETLATAPLQDADIAAGKFLGFAALLGAAIGGLAWFALALSALVQPPAALDWGESLGILCGFALHGLMLGAIGLFASSLSRSQVASFIAAFLIGFSLWVVGKLTAFLPGPAASLAEFLGVDAHLATLAKGVFDTRDLLYFASVGAAFLYFTVERLRSRGWLRALAFSGAGALLLAGALAALNLIGRHLYLRLDLSANRAYSLAPASKAIARGLDDDLVVRVYYTGGLPPPYGLGGQYLRDLLGEFRSASRGRLRFEWIDPQASEAARAQARAAGVVPVQLNVMARDRFEVKEAFMGAVLLFKGKTEVLPIVERSADLEYELARRIHKLAATTRRKVGFVEGHGERKPGDPALEPVFALMREELELSAVKLDAELPQLDALWLLAPAGKLKPPELERLRAWVASGRTLGLVLGRRIVDFRRFRSSPLETGLEPLLAAWGVRLGEGFVVDAQAERIQMETQYGQFVAMRIHEYPFIPIATRLAEHPSLRGLKAISFPFAHPIHAAPPAGLRYTSLADSSRDSWHYQGDDVGPAQPLEKLASSERGPFSLAGVLEGSFSGKPGRVLVSSSFYQFDERMANKTAGLALLFNWIEWSASDEALLGIRGKAVAFRPLRRLGETPRLAVKYLLILTPPGLLLGAAFGRYRRERRRRAALPALYAQA